MNTQATLAFSTPDDVRKEVWQRLDLFSQDGGYIFNPVHNIVGNTKIENIIALFDAVKEYNNQK